MGLSSYTIEQLETMLQNKEITAEEIAKLSFAQIEKVEEDVKAFLTLNKEAVLEKAKKLDEKGTYDKHLAAIPGSIKDNIVTKDMRTTAASNMLKNFETPLYDATVIEKLDDADALMLGKVNLDEFAIGSSTETSAFQKTTNPWNKDYVPGGSSGGSAASVAAGEVLFSLGSDTGGSIRQPAAFCGVVGMKPTYGLVSRYGLIALAPSLDQIGPITRTVKDNARVLEVIAGYDSRDSTSSQREIPSYTANLTGDIKGIKIAVLEEFFTDGVHDEVKEAVQQALKQFETLGAKIEEVSLKHVSYADATYYLIANSEASSSLARYDGIRFGHRAEGVNDLIEMVKRSRQEGFGEEVKRRILIGTLTLSGEFNETYFKKAQKVRTLIANDFKETFNNYDLIIGPTAPTTAFKFDEKIQDPLTMYTSDILTVPANLAGLPAISVPCGFSKEGLPIGLQIIGNHFAEETIYQAAYAYEQATDYHKKRPGNGGE